MALPTDLAIEIIGHLTVTSEQPMDDLCSLQVTCSSMRCICGNPAIGRCFLLVRFRCQTTWEDLDDYDALLASLTRLSILEACFFTGI